MELGWGVVGTGEVAGVWMGPPMASSPDNRVVACTDIVPDKARAYAAKFGVQRVYATYEELLRDPEVEAVYLATPAYLHHSMALAAAAARKHVLCEKPMGLTLREAEEITAACRDAGVVLGTGLQGRFQPALRAAARMVREGRLGEVREVTSQRFWYPKELDDWRRDLRQCGAGALMDVSVHGIDYLHWILDDEITRVFAAAYPPRSSGVPDETVTCLLEFSRGCQATLRCSRELPIGTNDLQLFGTKGMLATTGWFRLEQFPLTLWTVDGNEEHQFPGHDLYLDEIEAFAKAVRGDGKPVATGEDAIWLARVTDSIIRSLETRQAVAVDR